MECSIQNYSIGRLARPQLRRWLISGVRLVHGAAWEYCRGGTVHPAAQGRTAPDTPPSAWPPVQKSVAFGRESSFQTPMADGETRVSSAASFVGRRRLHQATKAVSTTMVGVSRCACRWRPVNDRDRRYPLRNDSTSGISQQRNSQQNFPAPYRPAARLPSEPHLERASQPPDQFWR